MLDIALKNVFRQKVRSTLTILGIAMGIGLILALGAVGEGLNNQIEESIGDIAGVIDVRATDNEEGISEDMIEDIKNIEGVTEVIPVGEYMITRGKRSFRGMMGSKIMGGSTGVGSTITFTALNPEDQDYLIGEAIIVWEGRKLEDSDGGELVVLLGSSVAEVQFLNLGDEIEYERKEDDKTESFYFQVIGILEETGDNSIDGATYVPLRTMQELEDDETITQLKVKIEDIENAEEITQNINDYSDDLKAFSLLSMVRQMEEMLGTIQLAVYGIAAISVIVGGIGIMNTMIMSVMERRREIGVMKAIGATTTMVLTQVLEESAFLSLIGGFVGLMLGYGSTIIINQYMTTIMTPELVAMGFGFSLVLGMGAGLYPAWSASQLDPIEVLRYE